MREYYRNNQPHFQTHDTAYSLTFLVYDAVTGPQLEQLRRQLRDELADIDADELDRKELRRAEARSRNFEQLEALLHQRRTQSYLLADPAAARVVVDYFRTFDGELYTLHACSVMSNHAHALLDLGPQLARTHDPEAIAWPLDRLVGRLKGGSAHAANAALGRAGTLWMRGYHDRYVRSPEHFAWATRYILRNPEVAGLVDDWRDHPGTWARESQSG